MWIKSFDGRRYVNSEHVKYFEICNFTPHDADEAEKYKNIHFYIQAVISKTPRHEYDVAEEYIMLEMFSKIEDAQKVLLSLLNAKGLDKSHYSFFYALKD